MVTAGGIFLGIAFLTTVLTQSLMRWPVPEKMEPGFVRLAGQVEAPGDFETWKPIPVEVGAKAGVPMDVIEKVAGPGAKEFSLTRVVDGMYQAGRADKNLARVESEAAALKSVKVKFYTGENADRDLALGEVIKAGVPRPIALRLAGQGNTVKGIAISEFIAKHPYWVKLWTARAKRNEIYKTVDAKAVGVLNRDYAYTLGEIIAQAKGTSSDADLGGWMGGFMIVNANGRKISADLQRDKAGADAIALRDGDYIYVPDRNVRYRTYWLVVMSLLVCTVGITNSMLMAVTERFKEIGTMKCLGALDKFVVELFMLESGMMGIVASILGWALGFLTMVCLAGFSKGWGMVTSIGARDALVMFVGCVGVGLFLTICATIAPAMRAASMPAAMALRSEI